MTTPDFQELWDELKELVQERAQAMGTPLGIRLFDYGLPGPYIPDTSPRYQVGVYELLRSHGRAWAYSRKDTEAEAIAELVDLLRELRSKP